MVVTNVKTLAISTNLLNHKCVLVETKTNPKLMTNTNFILDWIIQMLNSYVIIFRVGENQVEVNPVSSKLECADVIGTIGIRNTYTK